MIDDRRIVTGRADALDVDHRACGDGRNIQGSGDEDTSAGVVDEEGSMAAIDMRIVVGSDGVEVDGPTAFRLTQA
jgi:hypothetical protein